jgi:hypothetical protein
MGWYGDNDGDDERSHVNFFRICDNVDELRLRWLPFDDTQMWCREGTPRAVVEIEAVARRLLCGRRRGAQGAVRGRRGD